MFNFGGGGWLSQPSNFHSTDIPRHSPEELEMLHPTQLATICTRPALLAAEWLLGGFGVFCLPIKKKENEHEKKISIKKKKKTYHKS